MRTGPGTGRTILGLVYDGEPVQVITSAYDDTGQVWGEVMLQTASAGGLPAGYVGWGTEEYLYRVTTPEGCSERAAPSLSRRQGGGTPACSRRLC
ncbi:SH3 domain-containing protein [Streptomyces sp. CG1]|uniref:SH3 domain-containing protein n=1 Tax=Streptomyces sp. CG1 TaxID=1287523 RepID=UPI0034E1B1CF